LNVVSLFSNVPLFAIDSIRKKWIHITKSTNLLQSEFLKAIEVVLTSTFFTFNYVI